VIQNLVFLYSIIFVMLNILIDVTIMARSQVPATDPSPMTTTDPRLPLGQAIAAAR
jgi:hypothetical protein